MRGSHPERALESLVRHGSAIRSGERVVVACSGGADSVALALVLHRVARPLALQLILGHVHHGVRQSAWQDEAVVLRVAAGLGIPVRVKQLRAGGASESALRDARYGALSEIAQEMHASVVFTGHHAEDQTETVLLALFRGSGLDGLAGMPPRRRLCAAVDLGRPLLRAAPDTLRSYVASSGFPYAVDPTNETDAFRRNALRRALEQLRPLFPGLDEAVARAAELARDEMQGSERAHLRRAVRSAIREQATLRDVDFDRVEAVVRTLARGGKGRFSMSDRTEVTVENGALTVHEKPKDARE